MLKKNLCLCLVLCCSIFAAVLFINGCGAAGEYDLAAAEVEGEPVEGFTIMKEAAEMSPEERALWREEAQKNTRPTPVQAEWSKKVYRFKFGTADQLLKKAHPYDWWFKGVVVKGETVTYALGHSPLIRTGDEWEGKMVCDYRPYDGIECTPVPPRYREDERMFPQDWQQFCEDGVNWKSCKLSL